MYTSWGTERFHGMLSHPFCALRRAAALSFPKSLRETEARPLWRDACSRSEGARKPQAALARVTGLSGESLEQPRSLPGRSCTQLALQQGMLFSVAFLSHTNPRTAHRDP